MKAILHTAASWTWARLSDFFANPLPFVGALFPAYVAWYLVGTALHEVCHAIVAVLCGLSVTDVHVFKFIVFANNQHWLGASWHSDTKDFCSVNIRGEGWPYSIGSLLTVAARPLSQLISAVLCAFIAWRSRIPLGIRLTLAIFATMQFGSCIENSWPTNAAKDVPSTDGRKVMLWIAHRRIS